MANSPLQKIVIQGGYPSNGRGDQLKLGPGNNQYCRASDFNPVVDYINNYSSLNKGAVTQATSISTGVTLNAVVGTITTVSSTLAAAAEQAITLTNSNITASSIVMMSASTAGTGTPAIVNVKPAAGSVTFTLKNVSATTAFNNTILISFVVY